MPALLKVSDETCWDETGCSVDTGPVPDTGETGFSVQRGQGFSKIDSFNCAENRSAINNGLQVLGSSHSINQSIVEQRQWHYFYAVKSLVWSAITKGNRAT